MAENCNENKYQPLGIEVHAATSVVKGSKENQMSTQKHREPSRNITTGNGNVYFKGINIPIRNVCEGEYYIGEESNVKYCLQGNGAKFTKT